MKIFPKNIFQKFKEYSFLFKTIFIYKKEKEKEKILPLTHINWVIGHQKSNKPTFAPSPKLTILFSSLFHENYIRDKFK